LFILEPTVWPTNAAKAIFPFILLVVLAVVLGKFEDEARTRRISIAAGHIRVIMPAGCRGKPAMNKHRMNKELSSFASRLREAIRGRAALPRSRGDGRAAACPYQEDFDSLALELFTLQFANNAAYRNICEARGLTPKVIEHWTQIPAVPTGAFKELELSCIPPDEHTAVFHSSGTTEQKPSRHFHNAESLAVYETSLFTWFKRNVLRSADGSSACFAGIRGRAVRAPILLTPRPAQAPHSSLVHMFETVRRKLGAPESGFVGQIHTNGAWALDFDAAFAALNSSSVTRHPSLLLGTAFSFVHLLDYLAERDLRVELPTGSRVMETGGYKNRSRSMPKAELHALISERLGVLPEDIVCEYGMSELSSQAYAPGAPASRRRFVPSATKELAGETPALPGPVTRHFCFPPWARVQIISPETGRDVADGETGLIRVFDLANVFSVAATQTEDLGIRRGNGFELIGRAQLAEPRGCSLMTA
jgi:hypothetical protein